MHDAGDRRPHFEAALALGASPRQCTASVMGRAVRLRVLGVLILLAAASPTATRASRPPRGICSRRRCSCGRRWRASKHDFIARKSLRRRIDSTLELIQRSVRPSSTDVRTP